MPTKAGPIHVYTHSADTLLIETPGGVRLSRLSCFRPARSQEADPYCSRVSFIQAAPTDTRLRDPFCADVDINKNTPVPS